MFVFLGVYVSESIVWDIMRLYFFGVFFAIAQVYVASVGVVGLVTNCEEF
jgi:hypothetical protein